jgi:hypothetical protein
VKALAAVGVSKRELGPAYAGRFRMDWAPQFLLFQTVYPYAPGGPLTYTPPGQTIGRYQPPQPIHAGWYQGKPVLLRFLISFGFPKTAPDTTPVPASSGATTGAVAPQPSPAHGFWPAWMWIPIAAGILGTGLLVASKHRRRAAT